MRRIDRNAEQLFNYLRDVLYAPDQAALDLDALNDDFRLLGEGLLYFTKCVNEQRELAKALSRGSLSVKLPPPDNELAAPLKALHASLKHMTWQSQQVASGDYRQRIEFMGEFAEAFNTMTEQLDQRQRALEAEIENSRRKTLELEQSNSLMEAITAGMPQWIIVVDRVSGDLLYANEAGRAALAKDEKDGRLRDWLRRQVARADDAGPVACEDLDLPGEDGARYLSAAAHPLNWRRRQALALVLSDISAERQHVQQLEDYAYRDNLTGVHNRFYGMQMLRDWLNGGRNFCICFADLDNLKYVNDTYGHSEGDNYIVATARVMLDRLPGAVVCRLGGDEFMVLLPDSTREQGEEAMRRIRRSLLGTNRKAPQRYRRSISFGVVQVDGANRDASASDLLGLADERMYQYKRAHKAQRKSAGPADGKGA